MSDILTPRSYIENRQLASTAADSSSSAGTTQTASNEASSGFFGKDGPSFRDIFDAINPLNHIPIVSTIFQEATGHTPSVASQLAGGAMFGPIGFVASLANVIFEQQTGKDVGGTMYAALSGGPSQAIQVASAQPSKPDADAPQQLASIDAKQASLSAQLTASDLSNNDSGGDGQSSDQKSQAVLALFGGSAPSASRAYQKAQLFPYLKESSTSQVL